MSGCRVWFCGDRPTQGGRWARFSAVGAVGIAVQLAALMLLVSGAGLDYRLATPLAVEAAVVHNFLWHQRYTWADRRSRGVGEVLARLLRFHVTNGAVSLLGNWLGTTALVEHARVHYLIANVISIAACWAANFVLSDWVVFRRAER